MFATTLVCAAAVLPGPWGSTQLPPVGASHPGSLGDPMRGAQLARRFDCVRCHTEPRSGRGINVPPMLDGTGSRCRPEWLQRYLVAPEALRYASEGRRPRIRMPGIRGTLQDARDLAAYLTTLRDTVRVPESPGAETWAEDAELVAEGLQLFQQYQCRGCHALEGRGNEIGPALDQVAERRPASYVMALLRAPQEVIPRTPMEDKQLWEDEARALTAYLMTLSAGVHR